MKFNFLFIWLFIRKLVYSWHETIFRDMRVRIGAEGGRVPNSVLTEPLKSVLDKLQLLFSDGQPNNAAAMLFTKNEKGYYPQFTIQMARFRGTDKNEFIDNQRAYGNFFDLLDAGMAFSFKHWEEYNAFVGIAIYDDRIEVLNPGALPRGMTPENMKDPHGSFPYNPITAFLGPIFGM